MHKDIDEIINKLNIVNNIEYENINIQNKKNNSIIYINKRINNNKNIRIFGNKFVENNKNDCFIYINGIKKEICEY